MKVLISGGCKNGKSTIAEECCVKLSNGGPLYYIATMQAFDDEDRERIARHRRSRAGKGFITIEQPFHIERAADFACADKGTFILDSVTALMINELYSETETMQSESDAMAADKTAASRVADGLLILSDKVKNIIFVSDYIYSEAAVYSEYTMEFIKSLSAVDRALAKHCDAVAEICIGNINMIKGELPL